MYVESHQQENYWIRISKKTENHWASLGLFLTAYGTVFLASVILNRHIPNNLDKLNLPYIPTFITPILTPKLIDTLFFSTSFPALITGTIILSLYSIREIKPGSPSEKQYVAVLLAASGFAYQVIGAWPFQHQIDFPWIWQKQIVSLGPIFAWTLEILSLVILFVGVFSLYKHSIIYHQNHPNEEMEYGKTVA
jgi:hypothetical protein